MVLALLHYIYIALFYYIFRLLEPQQQQHTCTSVDLSLLSSTFCLTLCPSEGQVSSCKSVWWPFGLWSVFLCDSLLCLCVYQYLCVYWPSCLCLCVCRLVCGEIPLWGVMSRQWECVWVNVCWLHLHVTFYWTLASSLEVLHRSHVCLCHCFPQIESNLFCSFKGELFSSLKSRNTQLEWCNDMCCGTPNCSQVYPVFFNYPGDVFRPEVQGTLCTHDRAAEIVAKFRSERGYKTISQSSECSQPKLRSHRISIERPEHGSSQTLSI